MADRSTSDDLFHQAMQAFEAALQAAMKSQEECACDSGPQFHILRVQAGVKRQGERANWATPIFCESSTLTDWLEKGQKAVSETIAKIEENLVEAIEQFAKAILKPVQKAMKAREPSCWHLAQSRRALREVFRKIDRELRCQQMFTRLARKRIGPVAIRNGGLLANECERLARDLAEREIVQAA